MCDQIMDWHLDQITAKVLFFLSLFQWIYGMFVTIYLYGRKVCYEEDDEEDEEDEIEDDNIESNPYLQHQRQKRLYARANRSIDL